MIAIAIAIAITIEHILTIFSRIRRNFNFHFRIGVFVISKFSSIAEHNFKLSPFVAASIHLWIYGDLKSVGSFISFCN